MRKLLIVYFSLLTVTCFSQENKRDSVFLTRQVNVRSAGRAIVMIDLIVDSSGKTISATYQPKSSTTNDEEIIDVAKKKTLTLRWIPSADSLRTGTVKFNFIGNNL